MPVTIRLATVQDAEIVADFNRRLAWETEHKQLDVEVLTRGVTRLLGDPNRGFYLLAENGGEVVGQLMATFEWSDWRDGWFWWLQSVYVREDHRRAGVFRALFAEMVARARAAGNVIGLRLYVKKDNDRAHATYEQHGLKDAGYLVRESLFQDLA